MLSGSTGSPSRAKSRDKVEASTTQLRRKWHLIDAEGQILGRLASHITQLLMGKKKTNFVPYLDMGDCVVVINAEKVKVGGRKEKQKVYYRHSGFPGGFKQETLEKLRQRKPEEIIKRAVGNMLPKNKLRKGRTRRLKIFVGDKHPYGKLISKSEIRNGSASLSTLSSRPKGSPSTILSLSKDKP